MSYEFAIYELILWVFLGQKRIQNPAKHQRWSYNWRLLAASYYCKMLYLWCLSGFWIRLHKSFFDRKNFYKKKAKIDSSEEKNIQEKFTTTYISLESVKNCKAFKRIFQTNL